jgi:hypothetical protein
LVHPLPSSHTGGGPPTQIPPEHVSLVVQALASLHGLELLVYTHPTAELHESSVQPFPSSQKGAAPPMHIPRVHVSLVVQASPSLQGFELFENTQMPLWQVSVVQTLPSLH